jgi:hypothetical protein
MLFGQVDFPSLRIRRGGKPYLAFSWWITRNPIMCLWPGKIHTLTLTAAPKMSPAGESTIVVFIVNIETGRKTGTFIRSTGAVSCDPFRHGYWLVMIVSPSADTWSSIDTSPAISWPDAGSVMSCGRPQEFWVKCKENLIILLVNHVEWRMNQRSAKIVSIIHLELEHGGSPSTKHQGWKVEGNFLDNPKPYIFLLGNYHVRIIITTYTFRVEGKHYIYPLGNQPP